MSSPKPLCQLIGAGRAGSALAQAMSRAGYRFTWIGSRKCEDAERLARLTGCPHFGEGFTGFTGQTGLLFFSVPDDEIKNVAMQAVDAGIIGEQTVAVHLSGALGSDVLDDVRNAGAAVMAFHPAQSFTADSDPGEVFHGICFDMEGDEQALAAGETIAGDLGAVSVILTPEQRIFSHIAMTITSNYTVTLVRMAEDILKCAGISEETAGHMLFPLFSRTVGNIMNSGTIQALTGPAARGDIDIIRKHLTSLKELSAEYNAIYRSMAKIAVSIAVDRGDVSEDSAKEIKKMLDS